MLKRRLFSQWFDMTGGPKTLVAGVWTATATPSPATAPGQPTGVVAVGEPGATTVTWQAPKSNGGSRIISYRAMVYDALTGGTQVTWSTDPTGLTLTTRPVGILVAGTYYVQAYATNAIGNSSYSSPRVPVVVSQAYPPQAPVNLVVVPGPASALVSWDYPLWDGDSAVTAYRTNAFASPTGGTAVKTALANSPNRAATITGLTPGTTYYVEVYARNSISISPSFSPRIAVVPT